LVLKLHSESALALQQGQCAVHGLQGVARVNGVDQVCDEFTVTVGLEGVASLLQLCTQGVVVVHMAMVQHSHAGW
jgi:hypothetical protein